MSSAPQLSLAEWVVLALVDEAPTHGFAVASLTAAGGDLGRVWQIPRPVVYRSLARLEAAALVAPKATEPGRGPQRRVFAVTAAGHEAVAVWLQTPVAHIRDVRSQLLSKLALLDRRGEAPVTLLHRQRAALAPIAAAYGADTGADGHEFDATLRAWRRANAVAALTFIDDATAAAVGQQRPVS